MPLPLVNLDYPLPSEYFYSLGSNVLLHNTDKEKYKETKDFSGYHYLARLFMKLL